MDLDCQRVKYVLTILEVKTYNNVSKNIYHIRNQMYNLLNEKIRIELSYVMGKQMKYYLPTHFECVLCILLAPLLHGLRENGLELNYDIDYIRIAALVEYIIVVLDAWDEVFSFTLHNTFSGVSLLAIVLEVGFGWTLNATMTSLAVYFGVRSLLLEIIRLVKDSVKNSFLLLFSKMTYLQWTFYILSRITRTFLIITLTVCILVMRVTIIPKVFIPNSPVLVRPQIQNEAILWTTSDMGEKILISEERPEFKTNHFPKVPGEDICMVCRLSREYYPPGTDLKVFWKFNRKIVKNDQRHKISFYRSKYNIVFKLTLTDIQRSDYGEYKCFLQTPSPNSDIETNRIRPYEMRRIYLVERADTVLSVRAALGAAINIENVFIYNSIRNNTNDGQNEVDWLYTINNVNFSKACLVGQVFKQLWTSDYHSMNYQTPSCVYKAAEYKCNFSLIVCKNAYGLHEFAALKTDMTGNITINNLPIKIILLPGKTPISDQTDYDIYDQLDIDFRLDGDIKHRVRQLHLLGAKEVSETRKLEVCAKWYFFLLAWCVPGLISGLEIFFNVLETDIILGLRRTEYRLGFPPRQKELHNEYMYDIFMSFCDTERKFAYKKLLPLLRDKLGLKVCVPDVDMRHGRTLWAEYYEHISLSKKVIVIASEDYLRDDICNNMQFSMLIVPMLYTKGKSYEDIFILKYRPCNIPGIYNQFLTISHWDEYRDLDTLAREIIMWMNKSKVVTETVFFDLLFRVSTMLRTP